MSAPATITPPVVVLVSNSSRPFCIAHTVRYTATGQPQVNHRIFECHEVISGHEVHQERQEYQGDKSHEEHESQEEVIDEAQVLPLHLVSEFENDYEWQV